MEKQGMDRGKQFSRIGLLIFFFLVLAPYFLAAEEEEENPETQAQHETQLEVRLESSPANSLVNNPWSLYLLVNHPSPQEVNVIPPAFPSSLALQRVRTSVRTTTEGERWTQVEYLFTPLRGGTVTLPPFAVETPIGKVFTNEMTLRLRELVVSYEPRFRWLNQAAAVAPGEKTTLLLELSNWDPNKEIPQGIFQGKAPLNAIISEEPPKARGERTYHYTITVIPIAPGGISLGPFSFDHDTYTLNIPKTDIQVLPEKIAAPILPAETPAVLPPDTPFPQGRGKVFPLFQKEYDRIAAKAESLWNDKQRAEALAELRKNERDSFLGPFLEPLRAELEEALGLGFTGKERWRPIKISPALLVIFFSGSFLVLIFLFLFRLRIKKKNSRERSDFVNIIVLVIIIGLALIFIEEGLLNFPSERSAGNSGVLKSTQAYRIPDPRGALSDFFDEGQPVKIMGSNTGDWCPVETPDGRSGWVRRESVIIY